MRITISSVLLLFIYCHGISQFNIEGEWAIKDLKGKVIISGKSVVFQISNGQVNLFEPMAINKYTYSYKDAIATIEFLSNDEALLCFFSKNNDKYKQYAMRKVFSESSELKTLEASVYKKIHSKVYKCYASKQKNCPILLEEMMQYANWKKYDNMTITNEIGKKRKISIVANNLNDIELALEKMKYVFSENEIKLICHQNSIELKNRNKFQGSFIRNDNSTGKNWELSETHKEEEIINNIKKSGIEIGIKNLLTVRLPYTNCQFNRQGKPENSKSYEENLMIHSNTYTPFIFICSPCEKSMLESALELIKNELPTNILIDNQGINNDDFFKKKKLITADILVGTSSEDGFKKIINKALNYLVEENKPDYDKSLDTNLSECNSQISITIDVQDKWEMSSKLIISGDLEGLFFTNSTDDGVFLNHNYECLAGTYNYVYNYDQGSANEKTVSGQFYIDGKCKGYTVLIDKASGKLIEVSCDF